MSPLWLLFATLTVVGITVYSAGMKMGSANLHPLGFVLSLNIVLMITMSFACLVARYGFKIDVFGGLNAHTFRYAIMCGLGAALIDTAYFLALRYGGMIPTQLFYTVGGTVAVGVLAILCFGEILTTSKALGIVLGALSLFLLIRPS